MHEHSGECDRVHVGSECCRVGSTFIGGKFMARKFKSMDGNNAAAYVSYAFTEVAGIYPITPSSPMAEKVDEWSAKGRKLSLIHI